MHHTFQIWRCEHVRDQRASLKFLLMCDANRFLNLCRFRNSCSLRPDLVVSLCMWRWEGSSPYQFLFRKLIDWICQAFTFKSDLKTDTDAPAQRLIIILYSLCFPKPNYETLQFKCFKIHGCSCACLDKLLARCMLDTCVCRAGHSCGQVGRLPQH